MTKDEFIEKVNGKPWVDRKATFEEMDCYGLVIMYYRHVMGIELPVPSGYIEGWKMSDCWMSERDKGQWEQIRAPHEHGILFTVYRGKSPLHVGVMIDSKRALHCRGSVGDPGKVEIHSIRAIQAVYGKVTFHKYIGAK